jgi:uncharacterized Zn finger protein
MEGWVYLDDSDGYAGGFFGELGEARYYHHAVDWLARAGAAYQAAGREAEWQAYLGEIRTRHGRKYKLMGMMERFGER